MKFNLKLVTLFGSILYLCNLCHLSASVVDDSHKVERIGIFIRDLKICHQQEWRNLSIAIEYEPKPQSQALNVSLVKDYTLKFLNEYSNPLDFWEIMNDKFVHTLIEEFPEIQNLKSIFSLKPDRTIPFPRESIIKYDANKDGFKKSFGFTKLNYAIKNETFDLLDFSIFFNFKANTDGLEYPYYEMVDQAINEFFKENPLGDSKWQNIKPRLEKFLLQRFKIMSEIQVEVTLAK